VLGDEGVCMDATKDASGGNAKPGKGPPNTTNLPGLAPSIPEDMYHLIKKAVAVRKHLERNRADKDSKL
jgi:ribosomal protein S15P/S13E